MLHFSYMKIATIDYQSIGAPKQMVTSLKETGFAVLYNHPIPLGLFDQMKADWQTFFASEALKKQFMFDKTICPQDGYVPTESAKGEVLNDLKEFYQVYKNGRMPACVSASTWELFDSLYNVGHTVLTWIQEHTPAEVKQHFSCPLQDMVDPIEQTMLRVIHYPPQTGGEQQGALRAAAHEDINILTVLPASDEPGLEAMDLQGNWHVVPTDPGMLVINSGDPLEVCSRGYYKATTHRVRNPSPERMKVSRYSFPMFVHPKNNIILDLETGLTHRAFLIKRMEELGIYQAT